MSFFFLIALCLYICVSCLLVYGCLIADPETSHIAMMITQHMPDVALNSIESILGEKAKNWFIRTYHYIVHERNPILIFGYLVIALGSWSVMFCHGYPYVPSRYLGEYHRYCGYLVFILCMTSWRYACSTSPGYVTSLSMPKYDNYVYDNILYHDRVCPTLKIRKIARSKYDTMTARHVPRFDHYCVWLNQPVGEENYRAFLAFVLIQTFMCWYGVIAIFLIFKGEVEEKNLFEAKFINVVTGMEMDARWDIIFQWIVSRHISLASVFLLGVVMGSLLAAFSLFHIFLIFNGMTTNEFFKWRDIKKWHKQSTRNYQDAVQKGKIMQSKIEVKSFGECRIDDYVASLADDTQIGCTGVKEQNGITKGEEESSEKTEIQNKENSFDPGPMPENKYNLGILENILEVLHPRSLRKDATAKWKMILHECALKSRSKKLKSK